VEEIMPPASHVAAGLTMRATSAGYDFPTVTAEALRAVVAFAAASAEDDLPVPPIPAAA